jgi:D-alanine-D-alanine ligase
VTAENWQKNLHTPGDVVFNFVEDERWELYEKVAYGLEKLHRAQMGHDITGLPYAIKKTPIKHMMRKLRIVTPNFVLFSADAKTVDPGTLQFPVIIKPATQHAGIGISQHSVVTTKHQFISRVTEILKQFPGDVIAEEYIDGREIHVSVIGNGTNITVLPLCEIGFKGKFKTHWHVYTYDAKWAKKTWEYSDARVQAPATVTRTCAKKITALALHAYRLLKCRDIARFDMRINQKGEPFIVDVNMNPSINYYDEQDATLASVYALGWTYDTFIEKLLSITYNRLRK